MTEENAEITVAVDVTNPGQFFACCGLLELADRLWPGSEGWFDANLQSFHIGTPDEGSNLQDVLSLAKSLTTIDAGISSPKNDNPAGVSPIELSAANLLGGLRLDWWSDKSIKPWAGSMKEEVILCAMLNAIETSCSDPMNFAVPVYDPGKKKAAQNKREPFYFDSRRAAKSHPLDSGWSPDTHNMEHSCYPAVESLCFIGLQRFRPKPGCSLNTSLYSVWHSPLHTVVAAGATCGSVVLPQTSKWQFTNFFRTGERKHKAFGQATRITT